MKTSACRPLLSLAPLAAALALAAAPAFADPCDALYQAGVKTVQTPHHLYSTRTGRGGVKPGEAVYVGGVEYLKAGDRWQRSPMTPKDMIEATQERMKSHPDVCTAAGTQTIGGQTVAVFKVHSRDSHTDQMVRIFPSGLLQGSTVTLPDGAVVDTRYEYANVQAPPGMR